MGGVTYLYTIYAFACFSQIVFRVKPESFVGIDAIHPIHQLWEFLFYSVVTVTTLGYGDISPDIFASEFLSVIEVLIGVLIVIFLFGSLVSYHVNRLQRTDISIKSESKNDGY
jgi:hypothetical protein